MIFIGYHIFQPIHVADLTLFYISIQNRGLIDEIKELKSDKEVHLHEIQELKDLVKKYEDQLEKMAEREHKNTSKFIEHIQRDRSTERNSFAHGSLFRVSPDHFRPRGKNFFGNEF